MNSEFSPDSNVQTTVTYSGCAIMLVLDCSRSLGSDFSRMQAIHAGANGQNNVQRKPMGTTPHVGRNDPCPCGSGLKYKNCHGK